MRMATLDIPSIQAAFLPLLSHSNFALSSLLQRIYREGLIQTKGLQFCIHLLGNQILDAF